MSPGESTTQVDRRPVHPVPTQARRVLVFLGSVILFFAFVLLAQPITAATQLVDIIEFEYRPPTITINVGDSVTWTNHDVAPHTATDISHNPPAFDTGVLQKDESKTLAFNTPGTFAYYCEIHPNMRGVLTVQGTATTPTVTTTVTPIVDPLPTPIATGDIMVRLEPVAAGLTAPNWGISAPGDTRRLFVVDQNGLLWAIDTITGARTIFADLSSLLVRLGIRGPGSYDERGFLGVAFHPDYATNGLLYTYTSEPAKPNPDFTTLPGDVTPDHENVVREWRVRNPRDPHSIVDAGSSRMLFRSHHPAFNHNAGALSFGPDKMLYIATGDGGNADDEGPGHALEGNAQRLDNILGKILRINPLLRTSRNGQYGIPTDNPFVTRAGALGEIYAYGFRNPFRFSFDSVTGSLYVADVGQNKIEEVNIVEKGRDYGWRLKEGTFLFSPNGDAPGFVYRNSPGQPAGLRDPVAQYDHDEGIAVVGGFVYHGTAIPALRGRYVFGDFAKTFTSNGRVFYLTEDNQIAELRLQGMADPGIKIDGFGQDANGELYVLGNTTGTPSGTTGVVLRLAVTEYRVYLPLIFNSARVGGVRSTP